MTKTVHLLPLLLAIVPASALSQAPDGQRAYDRCLVQAAIVVSHRAIRDEDVFPLAKRRCAAIRASLMRDGRRDGQMLAALDAADASNAANFPDWMSRLRERRRLRDAEQPIPADPGYR